MKATVRVNLTIDELRAVIEHHWRVYNNIPKELYDKVTIAGHTLGVTAQKQKERAQELDDILQRTWPK